MQGYTIQSIKYLEISQYVQKTDAKWPLGEGGGLTTFLTVFMYGSKL